VHTPAVENTKLGVPMRNLTVGLAPKRFAVGCLVCVLSLAAALALAETRAAHDPSRIPGDGWGLDHVLVCLADPQAVKDVFAVKLGFAPHAGIKFPELGLDQATITGGRMSAISVLTQEATLTLHQSFRIASERYQSLRHCLPPIRTAL
jgi:hypothetical protein